MDLKELNYIVTIANEGSISRAAEKLFMAQSSLSKALHLYETELGVPIFVRTSMGVRPTAAGQAFLARARQILQQYHLAQSEVWDIENLKGGRVEFGISTFRGMYLLPPALKKFRQEYPGVHVQISEMDSVDLEDQILSGLLDLALIAMPAVRLRQNLEPLMRDEILIVATRDHPVMNSAHFEGAGGGRLWVDFCDVTGYEFILGPPTTILGRIARQQFRKCCAEPISRNTQVTADFAASMARAGLGLAVTYRSCRVRDENVYYLSIGREGVFLDLALAYPAGEYRSRAAQALGQIFHRMYSGRAGNQL